MSFNKEELFNLADKQLYLIKKRKQKIGYDNYKGNNWSQITVPHNRVFNDAVFLKALENKEIIFFYQPILNIKQKKIIGIECLVRWCKEEEILLPEDFIYKQENSLRLNVYLINILKEELKYWSQRKIKMYINFSPSIILNFDIFNLVKKIIPKKYYPYMVIEINEKNILLSKDFDLFKKEINKLKKIGVNSTIDDFLTGNNCFGTLIELNGLIKGLKIAKELMNSLKDNLDILDLIIKISTSRNLNVIVEGVETKEQEQIILDHGYEFAQGWLYGKAVPSEEIKKWVHNYNDRT